MRQKYQLNGKQDWSVARTRRSLSRQAFLNSWDSLRSWLLHKKGCLTLCLLTHFQCFSRSELAYIGVFFSTSPLKSHALLTEAFHLSFVFIFGSGKMKEQQTTAVKQEQCHIFVLGFAFLRYKLS